LISEALLVGSLVLTFEEGAWAILPFCTAFALWLQCTVSIRGAPFRGRASVLLSIVGIPAWAVAMVLQRLLFLRKPTAIEHACAVVWTEQFAPHIARALLMKPASPVIRIHSGGSLR
jgi:hypothetical protein